MIVSAGLPTCMEGMMYPVPFASPLDIVRSNKTRRGARLPFRVGERAHDNPALCAGRTRRIAAQLLGTVNGEASANLAAQTTTLRFGTGMLVTPMRRDIVVVAKQAATLDQFSNGRFILGFGVGAYREEFQALNPNWQVHRGDLVQESIQAVKVLFEERVSNWDGKYYQFEDVEMFPKPLQDPLPIYVGGNHENAYRRAALYGNGWLPAGMPIDHIRKKVSHL